MPDPLPSDAEDFLVVCLCAEWCGTCREYRPGFAALAAEFPGSRFRWIDVEDQADLVDDFDVENFPTLFIQRGKTVLFYGTMLPHLSHLKRTLEVFWQQSAAESLAYAQANDERRGWQALAGLREALAGIDSE